MGPSWFSGSCLCEAVAGGDFLGRYCSPCVGTELLECGDGVNGFAMVLRVATKRGRKERMTETGTGDVGIGWCKTRGER